MTTSSRFCCVMLHVTKMNTVGGAQRGWSHQLSNTKNFVAHKNSPGENCEAVRKPGLHYHAVIKRSDNLER